MINGKEFAEKMFSDVNNDNTQEKLYSTGSEELDAMLEKAFSEGYETAQKEFAKKDKDEDGENHRGLGRAYLIGGAAGVIGRHAGKKATEKALKEGKKLDKAEEEGTKKAKKVGAAVGAGVGAAGVGQLAVVARKNKGAIKEALEEAGVKLTKKNKKAAIGAAAALGAGTIAANAGLGALGAKVGKKKNDKERRIRRVK